MAFLNSPARTQFVADGKEVAARPVVVTLKNGLHLELSAHVFDHDEPEAIHAEGFVHGPKPGHLVELGSSEFKGWLGGCRGEGDTDHCE